MLSRGGARPRRARIVATIGPTSDTPERIDALLDAGVDVARVNCAHGTPASLRDMIGTLRARATATSHPLAILADLAGPKLRIGRFEDGPVDLDEGQSFALTTEDVLGNANRVSVNYADLCEDAAPGTIIHLNDGLVRLKVTRVAEPEVHTEVVVGGPLDDRKGLSLPTGGARLPCLSEKDLADLEVVLAAGVQYVGLSFVRSANDVEELRDRLRAAGARVGIVAKIEKAQAVSSIDAIVRASDAVMVARGDLGVEVPIEEVPILQKQILAACRREGKPAITATQMLESMVSAPVPTRAEATDVANAVMDGTDAVMLSGETANGAHPIAAVQTMGRIVARAEAYGRGRALLSHDGGESLSVADASSRSACLAAESIDARAIIALTTSGATARSIARWRPPQPVVAVTSDEHACRLLSLVWGVEPMHLEGLGTDFEEACALVTPRLRDWLHLSAGDRVVFTAGLPFGRASETNVVRIETL